MIICFGADLPPPWRAKARAEAVERGGGALCPAGGVQRRPGGDTAIVGEIPLAGVGEIGPPPLAGLAQHLPALALRPDQQLGRVGLPWRSSLTKPAKRSFLSA